MVDSCTKKNYSTEEKINIILERSNKMFKLITDLGIWNPRSKNENENKNS